MTGFDRGLCDEVHVASRGPTGFPPRCVEGKRRYRGAYLLGTGVLTLPQSSDSAESLLNTEHVDTLAMNRDRFADACARLADDPGRVRRAATYGAVLVIAFFVAVSALNGYRTGPSQVVLLLVPVVALIALRARSWRHVILAISGGIVTALAGGALFLGPPAAALVFLAVMEDPSELPLAAWASSAIGAGLSVIAAPYPRIIPFAAVVIGVLAGQLLRAMEDARALGEEAHQLRALTRRGREQTQWLEERTTLARELHDVVGHHVTAIVVQAEAGLVTRPQGALHVIASHGRQALGELDALVVHLRDPDATLAISAPPRLSDIDEILAGPLRANGVQVEVAVDSQVELDEVGVLTLYRIAQEALTNVARHADARHVWIEVVRSGTHVRLRVSDDGIGPPDTLERGSGLIGMQERVRTLNGLWSWGGRPGGGTMVDAFIPVEAALPDGVA